MGGDNANPLILRELRNGVLAGIDAVATAALIAPTTPIPSSGDVLTDLATLLAAVPTGSSSRLFFVIEPSQAKILATLPGVNGAAFPRMTVDGGSIGGITILVSGQLAREPQCCSTRRQLPQHRKMLRSVDRVKLC